MKKLADENYQCNYCTKVLKTRSGMSRHEHKCTRNLTKDSANFIKKTNIWKIEEIRTTSKSIHEVIARLQEHWLSTGIRVTFTSYPNKFSMSVRNSHNSPTGYPMVWGNEAGPKGYPGWEGQWAGTVEVIDASLRGQHVNFADLLKSQRNRFIKTGSGSTGNNFNISGMLFIYDFPIMHEEFVDSGKEFTVLEHNYNTEIKKYFNIFENEQSKYVNSHKVTSNMNMLTQKVEQLRRQTIVMSDLADTSIKNEFNAKHGYKLKLPSSIMVDDALVSKIKNSTDYQEVSDNPRLEQVSQRVNELADELDAYKTDNPEFFL